MSEKKLSVAGINISGGRKENFFLALIEYYPDQNRTFLGPLLQVKDEERSDSNEIIKNWVNTHSIKELIVDFPLSVPPCEACTLECPGISVCSEPNVKAVRNKIDSILVDDKKLYQEDPIEYEYARNRATEYAYVHNYFIKESHEHLISKSYKKRLKKGFLPYWNRPLDLWVWNHYYDQLLDLFNISFDSYGNTNLMLVSRIKYLRRHFPKNLTLFESNVFIVILELMRAKVINKKDVVLIHDLLEGVETRRKVLKLIQEKLNMFVYDNDEEILVRNIRAFNSFLLALSGRSIHMNNHRVLPMWARPDQAQFIVPIF